MASRSGRRDTQQWRWAALPRSFALPRPFVLPHLLVTLLLLGSPWFAVAQTINQISFVPASIASGGTSQLTIVLGNAGPVGAAATLTQTLTDTLPAGLTVAHVRWLNRASAALMLVAAGASLVSLTRPG